jgi:hypothetical protein
MRIALFMCAECNAELLKRRIKFGVAIGGASLVPPQPRAAALQKTFLWLRLRRAEPHEPCGQNIAGTARPSQDLATRNVNGFWVVVCQYVRFRAEASAENPIDCRIFFADNPQRKTESGIGGKNP